MLKIPYLALCIVLFPMLLLGKNSLDEKIFLCSNEARHIKAKLANGYRAFIVSSPSVDEQLLNDLDAFLQNNPQEIITLIVESAGIEFTGALNQHPVRNYLAIPEVHSVYRLDECLAKDKRMFLFTPNGSSISFSANDHICSYSVPGGFPDKVKMGFGANPENNLVVFELDTDNSGLADSLVASPEKIPVLFNQYTGKLPNFFVSENKELFEIYKSIFTSRNWFTAEVEYNGEVLSEVKWKELPDMTSYGKIHTPQAILSPHKDGFHFSPDIFNFNDITSGTTKIFYARRRDLLDEMVLYLDFNRNFDNQVSESKPAAFGNISYKKDSLRGWCADFNGENHYIDFEKEIVFDENFTLSVWVKPTELGGNKSIIGKGEALSIKIRDRKMLYTSPGIKDHASDSAIVNTNEWQHLSYVIASGETVKFYKNGELIESQKAERIEPTQHSLLVGSNLWDESFKGLMDELMIWNRNLSDEELNLLYHKGIASEDGKENKANAYALFAVIAIALSSILFFRIKKQRKKKAFPKIRKGYPLSNSAPSHSKAPSIQFFGGFQLVSRSKEDLTTRFSPKRKQILILVLIKTLSDKGITSKQLTNHLWAGHSAESAKNNRSTQVQRIRETLALNSGIQISYTNKKWIVELESDVYCDLAEYFHLFEELKQTANNNINLELLDTLLGIIEKGPLLPNMDDEWLDNFKSKISDELLDKLLPLFEDKSFKEENNWVIRLSRALLIFDPLNETLLEHNIRGLVKIGKNTLANECLEHFEKVYQQCYAQPFNKSITDIIA